MRRVRQVTDADLLYDPLTTGTKIVVPDGWEIAEDEAGRVVFVSRPTCATCKWARQENNHHEWMDARLARLGFPLRCEKAQMIDTQHPREKDLEELAQRMCVTIDGSEYVGELYVKPTFGCVQWEEKA